MNVSSSLCGKNVLNNNNNKKYKQCVLQIEYQNTNCKRLFGLHSFTSIKDRSEILLLGRFSNEIFQGKM